MPNGAYPVPYVLISRAAVERDAEPNRLGLLDNNGRRVCATAIMPQFGEFQLQTPEWQAPAILKTAPGSFEVTSFTEFSRQDRHKHGKAVEIYTVLSGEMRMYIEDEGPIVLAAGDEVVILPGAVHEVVQTKRRARTASEPFELLVRVHMFNCDGNSDKYVQLVRDGDWRRWNELSKAEQAGAYKVQA